MESNKDQSSITTSDKKSLSVLTKKENIEIKEDKSKLKQYWLGSNSPISNIFVVYNSSIFKIYEAQLKEIENKIEVTRSIYIIQLKFLDYNNTKNFDKVINKIIESYDQNFALTKTSLKRLGYILNEQESSISLVYFKDSNVILFNLESFLNEYSGGTYYSLFKLQMIYDLLVSCDYMHSLGKKIGLIHPSLLIFNKHTNSFAFVDFIYDELLCLADKANISQILPHFGYFSYEDIDLIDLGYSELIKKYQDNYVKTDVLLIICLINFFFTTKKMTRKKEEIGVVRHIETLINELQKEFLCMNHKLTNFLSYNSDYAVKTIIEEVMSLDYNNIKPIEFMINSIGKLLKKDYMTELCYSCQDVKYNKFRKSVINEDRSARDGRETDKSYNTSNGKITVEGKIISSNFKPLSGVKKHNTSDTEEVNGDIHVHYVQNTTLIERSNIKYDCYDLFNTSYLEKFGKRIHNVCFHLLCKCCYDSHICDKINSKLINLALERKEENKQKMLRIKDKSETTIKIKNIKLISYYQSEVEPYVSQVCQNHIYLERIVRYEEDIINALIDYINKNIESIEDKERNYIEAQIIQAKEKLMILLKQIEMIKLNSVPSEKLDVQTLIEKSRIIENINMTAIGLDNNTLNETIKGKIEKLLEEKNFYNIAGESIDNSLKKYSERVSSINNYKEENNFKSKEFLILIKELSKYSINYKHELQTLFKNDFQQYIRQLEILFEFLNPKEIKKANDYTSQEELNYLSHIKDDKFLIFDSRSNKTLTINYPNNFKFSRFLNLNKKLLVSGGVLEKNKNEFTPINQFLLIKYSNSNESEEDFKIDRPLAIESMNYNRDQHSFVKLNEFELMVIGGFSTSTCEIYSFLSKRWDRIASLNECLYNSSAFVLNELEIFVFFGLIGNEENKRDQDLVYSYKIEKLKLYNNNKNENWTIIDVKLPDKYPTIILGGTYCEEIDINGCDIIILGGKIIDFQLDEENKKNNKSYSNKILSFNTRTNETKLLKYRLSSDACFTQNMFVKLGESICMFSDYQGKLITIEI